MIDEARLINEQHNESIRQILRDMESHSIGEAGHAERVAVFAVAVGERLGLPFDELLRLRQAAALHDAGKITLDRSLLQKIGQLSEEEVEELRLHAQRSRKVVESLTWLAEALPMIVHHHERWDGRGYPDGLSGNNIPLGARIISVCEAFDVMIQGTAWKPAISQDKALAELERCSGKQFDPVVVQALYAVQPLIQPLR